MAMQKMSAERAMSFIDTLLGKTQIEKSASEISDRTVASGKDVGAPGVNVPTERAAEGRPGEKAVPEDLKTEKAQSEGATGREKSGDVAAGAKGVGVEDAGADNGKARAPEEMRGSFNTEDADALTNGKAGRPSAQSVEQMKVAEEQLMRNEMARAQKLSNAILNKVAQLQKTAAQAPVQAPAAQAGSLDKTAELDEMMKQAADEAYHDFVVSYQYGLLKRAEDEQALQQAMGVSPEQAAQLLDEVARENPEAVMPAEAAGEIPPEVAAEAAAEGETPNVEQAEKVIEELKAMRISEEEIAQAIAEVNAEGGEAGPGESAETKMASEAELAKLAEERKSLVKNVVREFRTQRVG